MNLSYINFRIIFNFRVCENSQDTRKLRYTHVNNNNKKKEAFLKATTVVKSRATSIFTD
jgi:hypothetical protein